MTKRCMSAEEYARRPLDRGFTLVELLIAVSIIVILASIGFPMYRSAVESARFVVCTTEIREISKSIDLYKLFNGNYPPSLLEVNHQNQRDPWGNLYEYLMIEGNPDIDEDGNGNGNENGNGNGNGNGGGQGSGQGNEGENGQGNGNGNGNGQGNSGDPGNASVDPNQGGGSGASNGNSGGNGSGNSNGNNGSNGSAGSGNTQGGNASGSGSNGTLNGQQGGSNYVPPNADTTGGTAGTVESGAGSGSTGGEPGNDGAGSNEEPGNSGSGGSGNSGSGNSGSGSSGSGSNGSGSSGSGSGGSGSGGSGSGGSGSGGSGSGGSGNSGSGNSGSGGGHGNSGGHGISAALWMPLSNPSDRRETPVANILKADRSVTADAADRRTEPRRSAPLPRKKPTSAPKQKPRKDKNLHPINSDYDLYSVGRDGESVEPLTAKKSHDDIIRANNGDFIGYAENY